MAGIAISSVPLSMSFPADTPAHRDALIQLSSGIGLLAQPRRLPLALTPPVPIPVVGKLKQRLHHNHRRLIIVHDDTPPCSLVISLCHVL